MNKGYILQVMGPVVDVKFESGHMPNLLNALEVFIEKGDGKKEKLVLEVSLEIGDNVVRTIAMSSTDGLNRGAEVVDTGAPITVPVGNYTLGRVFNVLGEAVDHGEEAGAEVRKDSIHKKLQHLKNYQHTLRFLKQVLKLSTYLHHILKVVKSVFSVVRELVKQFLSKSLLTTLHNNTVVFLYSLV